MASTPRPDTGTVVEVAGAAAASTAVKAPVAAVAPMKWRRSILMALLESGNVSFKKRAGTAVPRRDTRSRLIPVRGEQRQQNGLPGAHESSMRDAALAGRPAPRVGDHRNVDELRTRSGSGRLECAPIHILA